MEIKGLGLAEELKLLRGVRDIGAPEKVTNDGKANFVDFLKAQVQEVNQLGLDLDHKMELQLQGKLANPHEAAIAMQKADVSFKLMLAVKEQLEAAYQQIMRTTIG
jgi:flagellar hook-basal body complex protein FliE